MSFRQKIVVILLIACLAVGLVYTGIKANNSALEDEPEVSGTVETVYFWYSDSALTDFFTAAAVAFHEKNPDVRVIPVLNEEIEYLESINEASLGGEDFPDVFLLSNDSLEKAYLSGLASDVRDASGVLTGENYPAAALNSVTYKNKLVAYPLFFETTVLLYNKSYLEQWVEQLNAGGLSTGDEYGDEGDWSDEGDDFDEYDYNDTGDGDDEFGAGDSTTGKTFETGSTLDDVIPQTFDDIKAFAENYEAPADVEAVFKWDVTDVFYNYLFIGDSVVVGGAAGDDSTMLSIVNDDAIESMQFYQDMNQYFSIDTATSEYNTMLDEFLQGRFVFTIVTSDAIKRVENSIETRTEEMLEGIANGSETLPDIYEFGYAPIPDISENLKTKSLSVTNVLAINGYSEKKDAANRFATFLSMEFADEIYKSTGKISACSTVEYDSEAVDIFRKEYEDSIPLPKIVETSNLWVQFEITFTEIWQGADVNEMMQKLLKQIQSQIN